MPMHAPRPVPLRRRARPGAALDGWALGQSGHARRLATSGKRATGPRPVLEDLRASPETEQLLNQAVDADEQVREQAIEGLVRVAGGSGRKRELMEALGPHLDDLRHGDEETREEARDVILSMMRR